MLKDPSVNSPLRAEPERPGRASSDVLRALAGAHYRGYSSTPSPSAESPQRRRRTGDPDTSWRIMRHATTTPPRNSGGNRGQHGIHRVADGGVRQHGHDGCCITWPTHRLLWGHPFASFDPSPHVLQVPPGSNPQTQEEQRYSMGISAKRLEMSTPRFRCTAFATT
jgi:hypothetical protein